MPAPHPTVFSSFVRLGALLTVTAFLGIFVGCRLEKRGLWLPEVPTEIGAWTAVDVPLEERTVATLGYPKTLGRQYVNPFDEKVDAHVIAAASFDAYHEPGMCMAGYGFSLTAETFPQVFGAGNKARAMVLKHDETGIRVLMLYWVQYEDGSTTGRGNLRAYGDLMPRLTTGFKAAASGKQSVIVRIYTFVNPNDPNIEQARRNIYGVARGLHKGIEEDGKQWRGRAAEQRQQEGRS
ncbi:MAG TPA: exosortase-associated EpsI family protein [Armatimonadaceae bacterium]|nr:exosortase-associated EpsI family protein [Armatimonadaceae bacterium]